jgi:hypothetical protein
MLCAFVFDFIELFCAFVGRFELFRIGLQLGLFLLDLGACRFRCRLVGQGLFAFHCHSYRLVGSAAGFGSSGGFVIS